MLGYSWVAAQLEASLEGLSSVELVRETVAVYCENHMEHTDTLCGENAGSYVKAGVVRIDTNGLLMVNLCSCGETTEVSECSVASACSVWRATTQSRKSHISRNILTNRYNVSPASPVIWGTFYMNSSLCTHISCVLATRQTATASR
jgi:hypothetical protein